MNRNRTLEFERRWGTAAGVAAFAAAVLFVGGTVVGQQGPVATSTTSELLRDFHDESGTLLIGAILASLGLIVTAGPYFYLFHAAANRSPAVRRGLAGVVVIGPIFLGLAGIFQWAALNAAANDFATPGGGLGVPIGTYAEDLIRDQTTFSIAQGLSFAGVIGFVVGAIYTTLWAMRTGLLTRFMGTLGMALTASLVLLAQAFALMALMLWLIWVGLVFLDRLPSGRPPAWDAGEAIPWPRPGEQAADPTPGGEQAAEPTPADEPIEGEATEVAATGAGQRTARRERAKRRKRKRRRS
jgi:hypothetical protein